METIIINSIQSAFFKKEKKEKKNDENKNWVEKIIFNFTLSCHFLSNPSTK